MVWSGFDGLVVVNGFEAFHAAAMFARRAWSAGVDRHREAVAQGPALALGERERLVLQVERGGEITKRFAHREPFPRPRIGGVGEHQHGHRTSFDGAADRTPVTGE